MEKLLEDPYNYSDTVLSQVSALRSEILGVAVSLNVDPIFIASVIAEEADDHEQKGFIERIATGYQDLTTRYLATSAQLQDSLEYVSVNGDRAGHKVLDDFRLFPELSFIPNLVNKTSEGFQKLTQVGLRDVGLGNVNWKRSGQYPQGQSA
jgi:hypothetical protein